MTHAEARERALPSRLFDGVVCFGGNDWWYHNRGHYDFQMMRRLARRVPVLYVNSIGVRIPRLGEGGMFYRRVVRKLRSLQRGFVRIDDRFGVVSPFVVPGAVGMALSRRLLGPQVRSAARKMGIHRPLVWVTCPPAVEAVDALRPVGLVYERSDRWESFPEADAQVMLAYHRQLAQRADLTLYCSSLLLEEERGRCRNAVYVDHGVDFERFATADDATEPDDLAALPRPRIGFVGAVDASTFDPELFQEVVRRLPDYRFVIVGGCTLPEGALDLPNVSVLGQKPYEEVPAYMAGCEVLIMPWNDSDWIQACNPIKLKEYLAVGRPVVSTDFFELRRYEGFVAVAKGPDEFAACIRRALQTPPDAKLLRDRVSNDTWEAKAEEVVQELRHVGIAPDDP